MPPKPLRPLWRCPKCSERFVTANMWHSCGQFSLQALFSRSDPRVLKLFRKLARMVRACGPVHIIPQRTRIVFQVRVRFAGCIPHKSHLMAGFWLTKPHPDPRFYEIKKYAPRVYGHHIRIESDKDLDPDLMKWIRKSYLIGQQKHLHR